MIVSVIGADPGPTTGLSFLDYDRSITTGSPVLVSWTVLQVNGDSAVAVLAAIMAERTRVLGRVMMKRYAQVEPFVTGQSAGTKGATADYTRQQAFQLVEQLQLWGYPAQLRKAADVKVWATDKRLKAAGILCPPENRHGNDASRHALFCAVHDAHLPDPLR